MLEAMNDYASACEWVTENVEDISGDFQKAKDYLGHLVRTVQMSAQFLPETCVMEVEELFNIAIVTVNAQNALNASAAIKDPILSNVLRLNLTTTTQLILFWMADHGFEFEETDTAQPTIAGLTTGKTSERLH